MRVVLHAVANDAVDLDEAAVVLFMEGPEDSALDGLEAVFEIRDSSIPNDVGGIFEKAGVDSPMEREFELARGEGAVRDGFDGFGLDVGVSVGRRRPCTLRLG
jgi:hypothetical protein